MRARWSLTRIRAPSPKCSYTLQGAADDGAGAFVLFTTGEPVPGRQVPVDGVILRVDGTSGELLGDRAWKLGFGDSAWGSQNEPEYIMSGMSLASSHERGQVFTSTSFCATTPTDGHCRGYTSAYSLATLELLHNYEQTTSHQWGSTMRLSKNRQRLLEMDVSDNYPRGVSVWNFTLDFDEDSYWNRPKRTVYAVKTEHLAGGTSSNDNYVYAELGRCGIVEGDQSDRMLIVFTGEHNRWGQSLNNSDAKPVNTGGHKHARQLGIVEVSTDLESSEVFSESTFGTEVGGYYSFSGQYKEQTNAGIKWITSFNPDDPDINAYSPKVARVAKDQVVVLYELWTRTDYLSTWIVRLDDHGAVLSPPSRLAFDVRLPQGDDVWAVPASGAVRAALAARGRAAPEDLQSLVWWQGSANGAQLRRWEVPAVF